MLSRADMDLASPPAKMRVNDAPDIRPGDLPDPALLPPDHNTTRERWPKWKRDAFERMGVSSVWVGGSCDLVSVTVYPADGSNPSRFGHNRLSRPLKVGVSATREDTVTARLNQVPYWWQGLLIRVWCYKSNAKMLAAAMTEHLAEVGEPVALDHGFVDVGPDLSLDMLASHLTYLAGRMIIETWDDDALSAHLDRVHARDLEEEASRERSRAKALQAARRK